MHNKKSEEITEDGFKAAWQSEISFLETFQEKNQDTSNFGFFLGISWRKGLKFFFPNNRKWVEFGLKITYPNSVFSMNRNSTSVMYPNSSYCIILN